jgi:hypothetical protein
MTNGWETHVEGQAATANWATTWHEQAIGVMVRVYRIGNELGDDVERVGKCEGKGRTGDGEVDGVTFCRHGNRAMFRGGPITVAVPPGSMRR